MGEDEQVFAPGTVVRRRMIERIAVITGGVILMFVFGFLAIRNDGSATDYGILAVTAAVGLGTIGLVALWMLRRSAKLSYRLSGDRLTRCTGIGRRTLFLREIRTLTLHKGGSGVAVGLHIDGAAGKWVVEDVDDVAGMADALSKASPKTALVERRVSWLTEMSVTRNVPYVAVMFVLALAAYVGLMSLGPIMVVATKLAIPAGFTAYLVASRPFSSHGFMPRWVEIVTALLLLVGAIATLPGQFTTEGARDMSRSDEAVRDSP